MESVKSRVAVAKILHMRKTSLAMKGLTNYLCICLVTYNQNYNLTISTHDQTNLDD